MDICIARLPIVSLLVCVRASCFVRAIEHSGQKQSRHSSAHFRQNRAQIAQSAVCVERAEIIYTRARHAEQPLEPSSDVLAPTDTADNAHKAEGASRRV